MLRWPAIATSGCRLLRKHRPYLLNQLAVLYDSGRPLCTAPGGSGESQSKSKRASRRAGIPGSWMAFTAGSVLFGAIVFAAYKFRKERRKRQVEFEETHRVIGKAKIGGPWSLIRHDGSPLSSTDMLGKWHMVYFGFCHCPDVCPDELEKLCKAVDKIERAGKTLVPLFVTVDPRRDTQEAVANYVKEFSPKLVGLTGPVERIAEMTKAFRVYFSDGPKDVDGDYIVDHTIIMYLIGPDGEFVDYYGQNRNFSEISTSVILHMLEYEKRHGNKA